MSSGRVRERDRGFAPAWTPHLSCPCPWRAFKRSHVREKGSAVRRRRANSARGDCQSPKITKMPTRNTAAVCTLNISHCSHTQFANMGPNRQNLAFALQPRVTDSLFPLGRGQCEAACGPVRGHERASCRRSRVPGCTRGVVWCDGRRQPGPRPRGEAPWPRRSGTRRDGAGLGGESESGSPARAVARILARARRATATVRTRRGDRASGPPNPSARTETPGRRAMGRVRTRRRRRRTSHKPARGPSAAEADRWRASP